MHRHGYQGRKFGRERDQRKALLRGLAKALILEESIVTTEQKAKEVKRFTEKVITHAGAKDLAGRRRVMALLDSKPVANRLIDELGPKLIKRKGGWLSIELQEERRGDNARLAKLSFVDDLKSVAKPATSADPKKEAAKTSVDKKQAGSVANPVETVRQAAAKPQDIKQAPKRTGFRGNR